MTNRWKEVAVKTAQCWIEARQLDFADTAIDLAGSAEKRLRSLFPASKFVHQFYSLTCTRALHASMHGDLEAVASFAEIIKGMIRSKAVTPTAYVRFSTLR